MFKYLLILALPYFGLFAQQELYMPRNIQSAYEEGTRSFNGMPGDNYWQNSSDYKIDFCLKLPFPSLT